MLSSALANHSRHPHHQTSTPPSISGAMACSDDCHTPKHHLGGWLRGLKAMPDFTPVRLPAAQFRQS